MNRDAATRNTSRRSMAIGIWSGLLGLIAIAPLQRPVLGAAFILLLASIASGFALMLFLRSFNDKEASAWQRNLSIAMSFAIPMSLSVVIGMGNAPMTSLLFAALAACPVALLRLALTTDFSPSAKPTSGTDVQEVQLPSIVAATATVDVAKESEDDKSESEFDCERAIPIDLPLPTSEEAISPDVTQWLTRSLTTEGEIIEGGVRIDFVDGQRDATVHLSFCPPLPGVPEITTEDLDGCDLDIRVSAAYPFGARIAVRRASISQSETGRIAAVTRRIGFVAFLATVRRAA